MNQTLSELSFCFSCIWALAVVSAIWALAVVSAIYYGLLQLIILRRSSKKCPFLPPDLSDFSSVGIGKVRWGRREEEVLITPHQLPSLHHTTKYGIGKFGRDKVDKNGTHGR